MERNGTKEVLSDGMMGGGKKRRGGGTERKKEQTEMGGGRLRDRGGDGIRETDAYSRELMYIFQIFPNIS